MQDWRRRGWSDGTAEPVLDVAVAIWTFTAATLIYLGWLTLSLLVTEE